MKWISVRLRASDATNRARLAAELIAAGAGGVQEEANEISTIMPADSDLSSTRTLAATLTDDGQLDSESLGEVDWNTRFAPQVFVQRVGHLTIAPPWLSSEIRDAAHGVIIEPAMAFGTGDHPSTRGVLRLMHGVIRDGDYVADLGGGSAVLSIAAVRLGAARVACIESDGDAISNAEGNVARNGVADRVRVLAGDAADLLPLVAPVRVILANIISPVLVQLSPLMRDALLPGGRAILAGMLMVEREWMLHALADDGWRVVDHDVEGEWWSTVLTPA